MHCETEVDPYPVRTSEYPCGSLSQILLGANLEQPKTKPLPLGWKEISIPSASAGSGPTRALTAQRSVSHGPTGR